LVKHSLIAGSLARGGWYMIPTTMELYSQSHF
jgi:hypothetical protein